MALDQLSERRRIAGARLLHELVIARPSTLLGCGLSVSKP